eukprot:scaffold142396_cov133-Phaeocystis_antarctica.AAC.3
MDDIALDLRRTPPEDGHAGATVAANIVVLDAAAATVAHQNPRVHAHVDFVVADERVTAR